MSTLTKVWITPDENDKVTLSFRTPYFHNLLLPPVIQFNTRALDLPHKKSYDECTDDEKECVTAISLLDIESLQRISDTLNNYLDHYFGHQ